MRAPDRAAEVATSGSGGILDGNGRDIEAKEPAMQGGLGSRCQELLPSGRKRGRPPRDEISAVVDALFTEWSARTRARYTRAWRLLRFAGVDILDLIPRVSRPNGSLDVAKLLELAEGIAAVHIIKTAEADE
jgi:hypothetical protein